LPALYLMTWEPNQRLWRKHYEGKRYVVSCRQLDAPETKEGSYRAANSWWSAKRAEIDGHRPPEPHSNYIDELARRRDWASRREETRVAELLGSEISRIRGGGEPFVECTIGKPYLFIDEEELEGRFKDVPHDVLNHALIQEDELWHDRLSRDKQETVPEDQTVGGLTRLWLEGEEARVKAGLVSARGHDNKVDCLNHFQDWLGKPLSVTLIDAARWERYWLHLLGKVTNGVWSREYAGKVLRVARSFVQWLGSRGLNPVPANLQDRRYRFGNSAKPVPTMTFEEVRRLVENATGQLRLHLLLMANCGMTQKDIADLRQDEVEWTEGRITRKRSKTGDQGNVPMVSYKLWPQTWQLLQEYRAAKGEFALLTLSGRRWVEEQWLDGKLKSTDNIASNYTHLKRKLKFKKPLKLLRKTSASLLDEHETYGRYTGHFLGHAPRSIRDKHYVVPSSARFDEAVTWLGQQYGFMPPASVNE